MNPRTARAAALVLLVAVSSAAPLLARGSADNGEPPWIVAPGWRITWQVSSNVPFENETRCRVTITSIEEIAPGSWVMLANVSWFDFPVPEWVQFTIDIPLASYDTGDNVYSIDPTAFSDGFVFLPVRLEHVDPFSRLDQAIPPLVNQSDAVVVADPVGMTWILLNGTGGEPLLRIEYTADGVPANLTKWTNGTVSRQLVLETVYAPDRDFLRFFNAFTMIATGASITLVIAYLVKRRQIKTEIKGERTSP